MANTYLNNNVVATLDDLPTTDPDLPNRIWLEPPGLYLRFTGVDAVIGDAIIGSSWIG